MSTHHWPRSTGIPDTHSFCSSWGSRSWSSGQWRWESRRSRCRWHRRSEAPITGTVAVNEHQAYSVTHTSQDKTIIALTHIHIQQEARHHRCPLNRFNPKPVHTHTRARPTSAPGFNPNLSVSPLPNHSLRGLTLGKSFSLLPWSSSRSRRSSDKISDGISSMLLREASKNGSLQFSAGVDSLAPISIPFKFHRPLTMEPKALLSLRTYNDRCLPLHTSA